MIFTGPFLDIHQNVTSRCHVRSRDAIPVCVWSINVSNSDAFGNADSRCAGSRSSGFGTAHPPGANAAYVQLASVSAIHFHKLEARVKVLENAQSVQLARTKVFIRAMAQGENQSHVLDSAKLLAAVLNPDPQAAMSVLQNGN